MELRQAMRIAIRHEFVHQVGERVAACRTNSRTTPGATAGVCAESQHDQSGVPES